MLGPVDNSLKKNLSSNLKIEILLTYNEHPAIMHTYLHQNHYRPQGKVMFSQASVCPWKGVGGMGSLVSGSFLVIGPISFVGVGYLWSHVLSRYR